MSASVNFSKENPQDPFVKRELNKKGDHNDIMSLIGKYIAPNYKQLAEQFCIPKSTTDTIAYNNRNNDVWHALNDVVGEWLRGNTTVYDEGVKANARWLYDAVRTIDRDLGTKIAQKYKIEEESISTSTASDTGHQMSANIIQSLKIKFKMCRLLLIS